MPCSSILLCTIFCCAFSCVFSLTCLSCDQIIQPRHCHTVETCNKNEVCGAQKLFSVTGYYTYTLGCVPNNTCSNTTGQSGSFCNECCGKDLCNTTLCGEPDYPASRGPVCYDCEFHNKQHPCRRIGFCSVDEYCSLLGLEEFGDFTLTSGCKPKHACLAPSTTTPPSALVGKRSLSHVSCESCCSDDLCNLDCSGGGPCSSSPCVNGACNGTATDYHCDCFTGWGGTHCNISLTFDCLEILQKGFGITDGVYPVKLKETGEIIDVYCDMTTDGGGWTVFQKRFNGSVNFYRNMHDYENGFGDVSGEFWLGLKHIYQMTKGFTNELRLDLEKSTGQKAYEVYKTFSISSGPTYSLGIGSYTGTAGDGGQGLSYNNGKHFSTFDMDQDGQRRNCASDDRGGWWYSNCAYVNLNGEYATPGTKSSYNNGEGGVTYRAWSSLTSLKATEMKFRRK